MKGMRSFGVHRGVSLVDVLVGSALVLIIFLGLFAVIRASVAVSTLAKLKSTATSIATTRMEYVRSLSYDSVGTVGGIPAGVVPQYATTTTSEGIQFVTRTYIEYADDPADGEGALDENGVTTDYKHVKVSTTYAVNSGSRSVTLVSNFAPPGIETVTGGGTLRVVVVDALGAPVAGASVRIVNSALSPAVDFTTFSSAQGTVYLPGAATSTEYEVYVSKAGYSSAQTYARDATNANPNPGYLTVVENQTTETTFAIDYLSTLVIRTFEPIAPQLATEPFADASGLSAATDVSAAGGTLTLSGAPGSYAPAGTALLADAAPAYLASWTNASSSQSLPAGTSMELFVEDGNGALVPDADLPGNSSGFTGTIDLSGLSTTTYPMLALRVELATADPNVTPSVDEVRLGYDAGPLPLPGVALTLTGTKTVGSTAGGASIFKSVIATTTNASGIATTTAEWDLYSLTVPGHSVVSGDPEAPYELLPGDDVEAVLILTP